MKISALALGFLAAMFMAQPASARLAADAAAERPGNDARQPVRLAQMGDVEIVIDGRGRELVIDRRTGNVVAIRQRGLEPYGDRRRARAEELRRDGYPDRDLLLGERLDRELEVRLGLREPPSADEQEPRQWRGNQRDRYPRDGYPPEGWGGFGNPPADVVGRGTPPREDRGRAAAYPQEPEIPTVVVPAEPEPAVPSLPSGASDEVASIQVLLDRHGISPGVIDGRMGDNVNKALAVWRDMHGGVALRTYDQVAIAAALAESGGPAFVEYEITPVDVAGPYVASVPEDYGEKARMERLGFTSVTEMLAERFHMDENYLKALNPGVNFNRPGTRIKVVNVGPNVTVKVARIIADKGRKQVRGYDAAGKLVVAYPATIGSTATPSPSGTHSVERIAFDPEYTYNPRINFQQGDNDRVLRIPPGPNGPVGTIWIALSKPTYGIHGTPEPSRIGKTNSAGCVRLTNWDATELARLVAPGVTVEFLE